jgi:hypothetical protein
MQIPLENLTNIISKADSGTGFKARAGPKARSVSHFDGFAQAL